MAEKKRMTDFKRELTKNPKAEIENWDLAYYGSRYKKKYFNIDEEQIKDYFPAEHVK